MMVIDLPAQTRRSGLRSIYRECIQEEANRWPLRQIPEVHLPKTSIRAQSGICDFFFESLDGFQLDLEESANGVRCGLGKDFVPALGLLVGSLPRYLPSYYQVR